MKTAVVVRLETGKLQVVEMVNQHNEIELTHSLSRDYPDTGMTAPWLKRAWTEGGFATAKAIVLIPHHWVEYKSVSVPPLSEDQLWAAARMELENGGTGAGYLCSPLYHHQSGAAGMIAVKLAVLPDAELVKIFTLFRQAGIGVAWFGFAWRGLQNLMNFHRTDPDDATGEVSVNIETSKSELTVIHGDEILFHREFTPGARELTRGDAADWEDFCQEIRLSRAAYQGLGLPYGWPSVLRGFGPAPLVTKLAALVPGMSAMKLNIPGKASFLDRQETETLLGDHAETAGFRQEIPQEFQALIGLGLEGIGWAPAARFQILCRAQQEQKIRQARWRNAAGYLLAGLLFAGGLFLGMQAQYERNHKISAWLNAHAATLAQLRHAKGETSRDLAQVRRLETRRQNKAGELEFLLALEQNLPEGTLISDLTLENGIVKDLSGVTPTVSILLQRTKKTPRLRNLGLKGAITAVAGGELFHLEGPIEPVRATARDAEGE